MATSPRRRGRGSPRSVGVFSHFDIHPSDLCFATRTQRHVEQVDEDEEAGDAADDDPCDCAWWWTGVCAAVGGRGDIDGLVAAWVCVGVGVGVGVEEGAMVVVIVDVDVAEVEGCCETRQRRRGCMWKWRR